MNTTEKLQKNKFETIKTIVSKCFVFCFLMASVSVFASLNINDVEPDVTTKADSTFVFLHDNVTVYNIEKLHAGKIIRQKRSNQIGEIYLEAGAQIYSSESLETPKSSTKIAKIEKPNFKKPIEKKENAKIRTKSITAKVSLVFFNKLDNSSTISAKGKEKFVFSTSRTEYFSSALVSVSLVSLKRFINEEKKLNDYKNPSINVCYFSGKHSIRPPTFS